MGRPESREEQGLRKEANDWLDAARESFDGCKYQKSSMELRRAASVMEGLFRVRAARMRVRRGPQSDEAA